MNLITEVIYFPGEYSATPEAAKVRGEMVRRAQEVLKPIVSAEQCALVGRVGSELQTHKKEAQEAGLTLRRKLHAETAKIMQVEKDYLAPMDVLLEALGEEVTQWNDKENERVAREEAARQTAYQGLESVKQESLGKADRATKPENQLKHEQAAYHAEQAQEAMVRQALPSVSKAKGAATRQKLMYLVTDIEALYKARPELCTVIEKASAIQAVCVARKGSTALDPDTSIPGLKLWLEESTSFRRTR